jgi:hypothetical protein
LFGTRRSRGLFKAKAGQKEEEEEEEERAFPSRKRRRRKEASCILYISHICQASQVIIVCILLA